MQYFYHQYIKKYIHIYDPGYFSFFYALKAMVAISLSVVLHYFIFGPQVLVWAGMTPMQVFFLNATLSQQADRKLHMLGFAICSTFAVGFFTLLAQKALGSHNLKDVWWLALPVLFLSFMVGMTRAYSLDIYRMFVPVIVNSLVAAIYVDSHVFVPIQQSMFVVFSSAMIGIVIGFLLLNNPGNYGKYTQVYYPLVLNHLQNMVQHLDSEKEFAHYKHLTFSMIHNIKQTLHIKSTLYNDTYMIKNIKRALFYIYRIEDIYLMVHILPQYKIAKQYPLLQKEIAQNLDILSKIFIGKIPKIQRQEADKFMSISLSHAKENALQNIIKILYFKFESFCKVGRNADSAFNPPEKKKLKDIIKAFHHNNATFRFSIKYALAIGLSLLFATLLNINRGIWISLGVVSVVRPSVGGMQNISKEYIISATIGIGIGIVFSIFANTIAFYSLFILIIFLIVYLRVFPFWLWSGFMMCGFVMMYSIMYEDFLYYVLDRLFDIGVGILFAILVFTKLWPRFSHDNLKPLLHKQITILKDIFKLLRESKEYNVPLNNQSLQIKHADFLHNIEELRNTLKDSKSEKSSTRNYIAVYGFDLIESLESLILKTNELTQLSEEFDETKRELYINDIKALEVRFEMIENLLSNTSHFFRFDAFNVFASDTNSYFSWITHQIFQNQNQLYTLLNENHISIPN